MNNYCIDLNLDIKIFNSDLHPTDFLRSLPQWSSDGSTKPSGNKHFRIPREHLHPDFINLFRSRGLRLIVVETFYTPPNGKIGVHSDTTHLTDTGKVNWVYGGTGSLMHWYSVKDTFDPNVTSNRQGVGLTVANSPTLRFLPTDVNLVHSQVVQCPSIVQAGIPHNITNGPEDRYCISTVFESREFRKRMTIEETKEIFKEFLVGGL